MPARPVSVQIGFQKLGHLHIDLNYYNPDYGEFARGIPVLFNIMAWAQLWHPSIVGDHDSVLYFGASNK